MFSQPNHADGVNGISQVFDDPTPVLFDDLDCNNKNLNNVNTLNSTTIVNTGELATSNVKMNDVAPDTATTEEDAIYKLKTNTGSLLTDALAGQLEFIYPSPTAFPIGQDILWYNKKPLGAETLVMVGRDAAGAAIAIGSDRRVGFGSRVAFTGDRVLYDPCCLRANIVGTAWVGCGAKSHTADCFWRFRCHVQIRFAGVGLNCFSCKVKHYRAAALLRTYIIGKVWCPGGDYVGSCSRGLNGNLFAEDVADGDFFECVTECDAASANAINNLTMQRWEIYVQPKV